MVANGSDVSPLRRRKALLSSAVAMVFSEKGTPRAVNRERAAAQGAQFSLVYSVTGYLLAICLNSYGSAPPAGLLLMPALPEDEMVFVLAVEGGG